MPNLAAAMAESPVLVNGFVGLRKTLAAGELTGVEREIVALRMATRRIERVDGLAPRCVTPLRD